MAFHLCPLDKRVGQFFCGFPERLLRRRIPLAERAAAQALGRSILPGEAHRFTGQTDFTLGSNEITVSPDFPDAIYLEQLVSHLGSLFTRSRLSFTAWEKSLNSIQVSFEAIDLSTGETLVKAIFNKTDKFLTLCHLRSGAPGYAGKTLTALCNIAREQKLQVIEFQVCPENIKALQFYFHMDFGHYLGEVPERWIILL